MTDESVPGVGLADAIDQVRSELAAAIESGKDSPVRFRAGPVQLEFEVEVTGTKNVGAGIQVWVLSLGAKGERSAANSHKISITLMPVGPDGKDQLIGDIGTA
jgi:Trypsin-co-occurring domain 2